MNVGIAPHYEDQFVEGGEEWRYALEKSWITTEPATIQFCGRITLLCFTWKLILAEPQNLSGRTYP
jgi:hypothetical protein